MSIERVPDEYIVEQLHLADRLMIILWILPDPYELGGPFYHVRLQHYKFAIDFMCGNDEKLARDIVDKITDAYTTYQIDI